MSRFLSATLVVLVAAVAVVLLGSALGQWIPDDSTPAGEPLLSPGAERVTVDVRNAGGVAGMARTATDRLRASGFDVVSLGNAADFDEDSSVVIDRVGALQTAASVAEALGIRSVTSEPDSNLFVDVTVRLGSDWSAPEEGIGPRTGNQLLEWLRGLAPGKESER